MNADDAAEKAFGYPFYHIHRADLQRILYARALELGVDVREANKVVGYSSACAEQKDTVILKNGRRLSADLIVGADGSRSILNAYVVGHPSPATNVGDSAYRALIPSSLLHEDPDLSFFLRDGPGINVFMGPDAHIVTYFVRNQELFNAVLLVPDSVEPGTDESWKIKGDPQKLQKYFEEWDPRLNKLIGLIKEIYLWRLRDRPVLQQWVHANGKLVLLGDAAHPMLPYAASGAACAGEDAATLAACLERVTADGRVTVRDALEAYEKICVPRATRIVKRSSGMREVYHLHDGPEQQARDAKMKLPDQPGDFAVLSGYDAYEEVRKYFNDAGRHKL